MKKIFVFVGLLALLLAFVPTSVAEASDYGSYQEYKALCDEVASSKYDMSLYPYYIVQVYTNDGTLCFNVMYSKYPLAFCTKYTSIVNDSYLGFFHPSNSVDDGNSYVHASEDDSFAYGVAGYTGTETPKRTSTYAVSYTGSPKDGIELVELYTNHNIYNFETGELAFRSAPHLTELAKIVEQSNRQTTPTIQVIYLLPLAISLVVSFLALRTCLHLLRTILSGA